jgi:hypothetical protein
VLAAWWQEKQDEVMDMSQCRVAAHDRSLHAGFVSGYLIEPQNQDQRLGRRRHDPGAPRSFDASGHMAGSQGLCREDVVCVDGVAVR